MTKFAIFFCEYIIVAYLYNLICKGLGTLKNSHKEGKRNSALTLDFQNKVPLSSNYSILKTTGVLELVTVTPFSIYFVSEN